MEYHLGAENLQRLAGNTVRNDTGGHMPLTGDFGEAIRERLQRDPGFGETLLEEGVKCLLAGEMDIGKSVLRDYVNAMIGVQELGGLTPKSPRA